MKKGRERLIVRLIDRSGETELELKHRVVFEDNITRQQKLYFYKKLINLTK